jgi:altronate dehydratase large subunit
MKTFLGYKRGKGASGVRNHMAVVSSVICANFVVDEIARQLPGVLPITHTHGCGGTGEIALRTLSGIGSNPNIGALLIIGLGCEESGASEIADAVTLASGDRPVECLIIQESGGSAKTVKRGVEIAGMMLRKVRQEKRRKVPVGDLMLGLKCGGSDALSGISANPAVGVATDLLIKEGGTAILSEIIGGEKVGSLLKRRVENDRVSKKIDAYIDLSDRASNWSLSRFGRGKVFPGNMEGGLTTSIEKALGGITKGGTTTIRDCVPYATKIGTKGLVLMESGGYDIEQITGMAACGAQLIVFTTGRGTPAGLAGVPVIKVSSNSVIYGKMRGDIDLNTGAVIDGRKTIREAGEELFDLIVKVARGKLTKAERNRQNHFAIRQEGFSWPSLKEIAQRGF